MRRHFRNNRRLSQLQRINQTSILVLPRSSLQRLEGFRRSRVVRQVTALVFAERTSVPVILARTVANWN